MESCINAIRPWMNTDNLKINASKTELLIISTKQQLNKIHIDKLPVRRFCYKTSTSHWYNISTTPVKWPFTLLTTSEESGNIFLSQQREP